MLEVISSFMLTVVAWNRKIKKANFIIFDGKPASNRLNAEKCTGVTPLEFSLDAFHKKQKVRILDGTSTRLLTKRAKVSQA